MFAYPTPLLKEERDFRFLTLLQDVVYPFSLDWSCARSRFATDNDPINTIKWKIIYRTNQRLD